MAKTASKRAPEAPTEPRPVVPLSEIVGQTRAVEALRRALAHGRLAGAYLFSGPAGVGKQTTATALARAVNCLERPDDPEGGCDRCSSCHKIDADQHPDLVRLEREDKLIKVDAVRALEEQVAFPPNEARRRLVIIDGAEYLNENAANALLKSVEEPRPDTTFVLVTAAVQRVIPTLRSRCQLVRFGALTRDGVTAVLRRVAARRDDVDIDEAALEQVLSFAEGSPGRALELLGSEVLDAARTVANQLLAASGAAKVQTIFAAAEAAGRDRAVLGEAIELLRAYHRDIMLIGEGVGPERLVYVGQIDALRAEAERISRAGLMRRLRALNEAEEALLGYVNPRLTLEALAVAIARAR